MFNFASGMCGKLGPGMCRLSMNGDIAVKTSTGYKSYNLKTGNLVNCSGFLFSGDAYNDHFQNCLTTFQEYLGERSRTVKTEEVADAIIQIVKDNAASRTASISTPAPAAQTDENGYIVW